MLHLKKFSELELFTAVVIETKHSKTLLYLKAHSHKTITKCPRVELWVVYGNIRKNKPLRKLAVISVTNRKSEVALGH